MADTEAEVEITSILWIWVGVIPMLTSQLIIAKEQVATLDDCLTNYRLWLWRLIQNADNREALSDWETMYLYRFLHLCNNLETYHTLVCFCIDRPHRASDSTEIVCHTQILWNAAVWYRLNKI